MDEQQTRTYTPDFSVEEIALDDVLQPYQEISYESEANQEEAHASAYDPYAYDAYEDEQDIDEHEGRFRMAMSAVNMISILVGMFVILVLVTLLFTLFNWVKTDIMTSLVWFQSGLQ